MVQLCGCGGKESSINIHAKKVMMLKELATINGQTDELSASVNEDGQPESLWRGKETSGTLSFSGNSERITAQWISRV